MRCETVRDVLHRQLDGDRVVQAHASAAVAHLVTCAACRAWQSDLERLTRLVEHLPPVSTPVLLAERVVTRLPERGRVGSGLAWWRPGAGVKWTPVAGLAGLLLLLYSVIATKGVSLLNLPTALAEWAGLLDLSDLSSLVGATSVFGLNVQGEFLIGVSLLLVAVFGLLVQAIAKPPALAQ